MRISREVTTAIASAVLGIALVFPCFAQSPGSVQLSSDEYFKINTSRGKVTCGLVDGRYLPGSLASDRSTFTPYKVLIRTLKNAIKLAIGRKRAKLLNRLGLTVSKNSVSKRQCSKGPSAADPQNTPTSGSTPRPTATPPPTQQGCFDSQGNTTKFGIPSGVSGNRNRGQTSWNSPRSPSSCQGCHISESKRNKSFSTVSNAFNQAVMSAVARPGTQELADIVAYLNSTNTNCP
ncbi:MAG: hypothetical protein DCC75_07095 [Proteobacteria bacterium]|nr:MAG: hypothetical protein DCC75_07095 [Pseudomonadota bacterium]